MKTFVSLIIFCLIATISARRQVKILNGRDAEDNKFPYLVSIDAHYKSNSTVKTGFCSGAILNEHWILTAAHCLLANPSPISSIFILGGGNKLDKQKEFYKAESYIYQQNYSLYENDIALIRVNGSIKFSEIIHPINLPTYDFKKHNIRATFAGWGGTKKVNDSWPTVNNLQETELNIFNHIKCSQIYKKKFGIDIMKNVHICAFNQLNDGICFGDSGGPLVIGGTVIGIASFSGSADCGTDVPDIFTKVYGYLDWIYYNMQNYPDVNFVPQDTKNL